MLSSIILITHNNETLTTGEIMKALTKKQIKEMLKSNMSTGLSHLEAMEALQNEYEMYSSKIQDVAVEMLVSEAF